VITLAILKLDGHVLEEVLQVQIFAGDLAQELLKSIFPQIIQLSQCTSMILNLCRILLPKMIFSFTFLDLEMYTLSPLMCLISITIKEQIWDSLR
jgi:hypothetical protein